MNNLLQINEVLPLARLRRFIVVLAAGLFVLLMTTACSPADSTTASAPEMSVPEATTEAVNQAQSNLSDKAVDEDSLSRQSPSLAK